MLEILKLPGKNMEISTMQHSLQFNVSDLHTCRMLLQIFISWSVIVKFFKMTNAAHGRTNKEE